MERATYGNWKMWPCHFSSLHLVVPDVFLFMFLERIILDFVDALDCHQQGKTIGKVWRIPTVEDKQAKIAWAMSVQKMSQQCLSLEQSRVEGGLRFRKVENIEKRL